MAVAVAAALVQAAVLPVQVDQVLVGLEQPPTQARVLTQAQQTEVLVAAVFHRQARLQAVQVLMVSSFS
jgi:hypothetical protein